MLDTLFITPNNSKAIYQGLSSKYAAIETPTWSLLLAEACRVKKFEVQILDCLAENLGLEESYERIIKLSPRLLTFVIYGQNVNAGTTNMSGAVLLSKYLKKRKIKIPIAFIGSHVQALPVETIKKENSIDFVFTNEGVYSLLNILKLKKN